MYGMCVYVCVCCGGMERLVVGEAVVVGLGGAGTLIWCLPDVRHLNIDNGMRGGETNIIIP